MDLGASLGPRPARPTPQGRRKPLNFLVLGSNTRAGQGAAIGGATPGLSDTALLLHVSGDRQRAYGVSLPRDAMVKRPACPLKRGSGVDAGGLTQFNAAYAIGGPACTIKTVEAVTGVFIDHFIVIDFAGFRAMVDALGGVRICVPREVNDDIGKIYLPKGTYTVNGRQALDYVRLRHDLSQNGDIGRIRRQQAFIASMANKAVSSGTLANPLKLVRFLDAATKSLTTDTALANLKGLATLGGSLKNIGLDNIEFITAPFEPYPPDPNRVQLAASAQGLWRAMSQDRPLPLALGNGSIKASKPPGNTGTTKRRDEGTPDAAANGLCS